MHLKLKPRGTQPLRKLNRGTVIEYRGCIYMIVEGDALGGVCEVKIADLKTGKLVYLADSEEVRVINGAFVED